MSFMPSSERDGIPQAATDAMTQATRAMMNPVLQGLGMWSDMLRAGQPKPKAPTPMDLMQAFWHTPTAFAGGFATGLARPSYGTQPELPFAVPFSMGPTANPFTFWSALMTQSATPKSLPAAPPYSTYRSSGGYATAQIADPLTVSVLETTRAAVRLQAALWPFASAMWPATSRGAAE